ncbi:MAG: cysteine desulfurase [Anaerolineaceae bacterium]|nr:cysteine desulfurase [Anaerolineaceae bacterium]
MDTIKETFPALGRQTTSGADLVYLDSAATSQKPECVLQAMDDYYRRSNANIHRGIHTLAEEATAAYEGARQRIATFIGAASYKEVIFTRNATESINLVAYAWGRKNLKAGDVVLLTEMEHHANLVPWQMLAEERGIRLAFISVTEEGLLELDQYEEMLQLEPKLVSFIHMSNVLGTINPAKEMIRKAKAAGAVTLLDGAQSVPHFAVDVQDLDVDFFAFSGHKMCGPTGVGVLYGREALLQAMPPFLGGGDMIRKVHLRSFTPNELPYKFEAGTSAIAEAIGLGAAVDFLEKIGMSHVTAHERELTRYAMQVMGDIPWIHILGPGAEQRGGVISFTLDGVHPHDIAQLLDWDGIAVRAGHHCAMPLHEKFNISATTRASFYIYNDLSDVDALVASLRRVKEKLG